MALVHVVGLESLVAEGVKHPEAADAENAFLAQAVAPVATIELIRQTPLGFTVLFEIAVEKVDGNGGAEDAVEHLTPAAEDDGFAFDLASN